MDGKGFQVLVAQLSDLSGVQRAALITALENAGYLPMRLCN